MIKIKTSTRRGAFKGVCVYCGHSPAGLSALVVRESDLTCLSSFGWHLALGAMARAPLPTLSCRRLSYTPYPSTYMLPHAHTSTHTAQYRVRSVTWHMYRGRRITDPMTVFSQLRD